MQGGRHALGPHITVYAFRPVIGLAEVPGAVPDVRGPSLGDGEGRTRSKAKAVMPIPLKSVAKEKHQVAEPACAEMEAEV